ncbi:2262_t:CDS:2 [Ambispora gerdemannii]|uniref:2262_t:CDS:1 n=1 Tax=Ambispora gerdemannii TaxID=144530 RepID=A0A9N9CGQ2_9GLOM|nr:2262_t:CDS:2 [Ambispora gerdemannii]
MNIKVYIDNKLKNLLSYCKTASASKSTESNKPPIQVAVDPQLLSKLLQIEQTNAIHIQELVTGQSRIEAKLNAQHDQLEAILSGGKGKKTKSSEEFYQELIKDKLLRDEDSAEQLKKLKEKGISFTKLWEKKIYSAMLIPNRAKKGYYKQQKDVKKVHEEIYAPSDPDNPASDTFLTLIIKAVFPTEEERTQANAIWTQAVLEVIFDEEHTSSKIEADIVEAWTHKISATQTVEW